MATEKNLVDNRYTVPDYLTRPRKYALGKMSVADLDKLRVEVNQHMETNRNRYERDASAYTRLVLEARKIWPANHEVIKLLQKHPVLPPPDMIKLWDKLLSVWREERKKELARLRKNELARARYARWKAEQQQAAGGSA